MIDLRFFGSFEAWQRDGKWIRPPGRRSIALLTCLAINDQPWRRRELAALLWPDRDLEQSRASLRQEILRLKKVFVSLVQSGPVNPETLLTLDRQRLDTDVSRFRAAASDPARALEAVALYRGELLEKFELPGNGPFTDWLRRQRNEMRSTAVACLRFLLNGAEASEPVARRLMDLSPDCEEAHVWLVHHYVDSGDISRAIECYSGYAADVRASGREPSEELKALLSDLLASQQRLSGNANARATAADTTEWIRTMRDRTGQLGIPDSAPLKVVTGRPSLVVLPFVDYSPRSVEPHVIDGLTEELTNSLARMPGFFVTSRHSAIAYKSVVADVRVIAAELGVRYLIEGSVERHNQRVRVNTRLIDGGTGLHVWADTQDMVTGDVMDVRDQLVQAISARLQPSLMKSEVLMALRRPTQQLDAWGWMQRALGALLHLENRQHSLTHAVDDLKRALELDERYAMAHALLGAVYTWRTLTYAFLDPEIERRMARAHAETAMRLEPDNPFVLVHCAETAFYSSGQIDAARGMLELAVNRNPNDAHSLALLGNILRFAGDDVNTCLALIKQAMRLSPRDLRTYSWLHYGSWCHWKLGALSEMELAARHSVELYPRYPHSWIALTSALGLQGKFPEAREAARTLKTLHPSFDPAKFYEIARHFYGRRFSGQVISEYQELRNVLSRSLI